MSDARGDGSAIPAETSAAVSADIVVVGDGVAAAAALITLGAMAPERDILQIAPAELEARPGEQGRGIGEHLSAPGFALLQELGLEDSFRAEGHLETHASYSAWGSPLLQERNALMDPHAVGWAIDRGRFDAWLRRNARERRRCRFREARLVEATVHHAREDPNEGGVCLTLGDGRQVRGAFVLDASGRKAAVARHLTSRRRLDRQIAVYDIFEQVEPEVEPTAGPMVEAMPDGWLYSALRPDGRLVVLWFTDGDLMGSPGADQPRRAGAFRESLKTSVYTRKRIETAGFDLDRSELDVPAAVDAGTRLNDAVVGPGWAAIGDAAGAFDPLSSHGLTAALWTGRRAALALVRKLDGDGAAPQDTALQDYENAFARGFELYRAQRRALYRAERRFDGPFWRRRQKMEQPGSRQFAE